MVIPAAAPASVEPKRPPHLAVPDPDAQLPSSEAAAIKAGAGAPGPAIARRHLLAACEAVLHTPGCLACKPIGSQDAAYACCIPLPLHMQPCCLNILAVNTYLQECHSQRLSSDAPCSCACAHGDQGARPPSSPRTRGTHARPSPCGDSGGQEGGRAQPGHQACCRRTCSGPARCNWTASPGFT